MCVPVCVADSSKTGFGLRSSSSSRSLRSKFANQVWNMDHSNGMCIQGVHMASSLHSAHISNKCKLNLFPHCHMRWLVDQLLLKFHWYGSKFNYFLCQKAMMSYKKRVCAIFRIKFDSTINTSTARSSAFETETAQYATRKQTRTNLTWTKTTRSLNHTKLDQGVQPHINIPTHPSASWQPQEGSWWRYFQRYSTVHQFLGFCRFWERRSSAWRFRSHEIWLAWHHLWPLPWQCPEMHWEQIQRLFSSIPFSLTVWSTKYLYQSPANKNNEQPK